MTRASTEARIAKLLSMVAAVEEAIIRLEGHADGSTEGCVERLRVLQGELCHALALVGRAA